MGLLTVGIGSGLIQSDDDSGEEKHTIAAADGSGTAYTLYQLLSEGDAGLTFYAQWTTN